MDVVIPDTGCIRRACRVWAIVLLVGAVVAAGSNWELAPQPDLAAGGPQDGGTAKYERVHPDATISRSIGSGAGDAVNVVMSSSKSDLRVAMVAGQQVQSETCPASVVALFISTSQPAAVLHDVINNLENTLMQLYRQTPAAKNYDKVWNITTMLLSKRASAYSGLSILSHNVSRVTDVNGSFVTELLVSFQIARLASLTGAGFRCDAYNSDEGQDATDTVECGLPTPATKVVPIPADQIITEFESLTSVLEILEPQHALNSSDTKIAFVPASELCPPKRLLQNNGTHLPEWISTFDVTPVCRGCSAPAPVPNNKLKSSSLYMIIGGVVVGFFIVGACIAVAVWKACHRTSTGSGEESEPFLVSTSRDPSAPDDPDTDDCTPAVQAGDGRPLDTYIPGYNRENFYPGPIPDKVESICLSMNWNIEELLTSDIITSEQYNDVIKERHEVGSTDGLYLLSDIIKEEGKVKEFARIARDLGVYMSSDTTSSRSDLTASTASLGSLEREGAGRPASRASGTLQRMKTPSPFTQVAQDKAKGICMKLDLFFEDLIDLNIITVAQFAWVYDRRLVQGSPEALEKLFELVRRNNKVEDLIYFKKVGRLRTPPRSRVASPVQLPEPYDPSVMTSQGSGRKSTSPTARMPRSRSSSVAGQRKTDTPSPLAQVSGRATKESPKSLKAKRGDQAESAGQLP